jgi:hypothetical protein
MRIYEKEFAAQYSPHSQGAKRSHVHELNRELPGGVDHVKNHHFVRMKKEKDDIRDLVNHELAGAGNTIALSRLLRKNLESFYLGNDATFDCCGCPGPGFAIVENENLFEIREGLGSPYNSHP